MRLSRSNRVICLALLLAACGGGGGGGGGPSSTPTPPPAPPPPPPVPPVYPLFDAYTGGLASGVATRLGDITVKANGDGNYVVSSFAPSSQDNDSLGSNITFARNADGSIYMDWTTFQPRGTDPLFAVSGYKDPQYAESLTINRNGAAISLDYTRFGSHLFTIEGEGSLSFVTYGVGTQWGTVPTMGTASYNGFVDGLYMPAAGPQQRLYGSSATMTVNFGTGMLSTLLTLFGRADPFGNFSASTPVAIGTASGSGQISSGQNNFNGILSGGFNGTFRGTFNGPDAVEYGYGFKGTDNQGGSVFGTAVGKKN